MDTDTIKVIDRCSPQIVVVDRTTPGSTIRIEAEEPRRPVEFYFGSQSSCPGGVCPPQQSKPARRGLLR